MGHYRVGWSIQIKLHFSTIRDAASITMFLRLEQVLSAFHVRKGHNGLWERTEGETKRIGHNLFSPFAESFC